MINLKIYLMKNKITQTDLSERTSVCLTMLNLIINGRRNSPQKVLEKIAKELDLCPLALRRDVIKPFKPFKPLPEKCKSKKKKNHISKIPEKDKKKDAYYRGPVQPK